MVEKVDVMGHAPLASPAMRAAGAAAEAAWPGTLLVRMVDRLFAWQRRAAERYHLASLDDRLLRDIGLSRADVLREIDKPFWR